MCSSSTGDCAWTAPDVTNTTGNRLPRSPSHESVTTDLSLFSVSSAASEAKALRLKAGLTPGDVQILRGSSPNPDCRSQRSTWYYRDEVLISCAALCSALGLRRSFSTSDIITNNSPVPHPTPFASAQRGLRGACSEVRLGAALEGAARALAATSRSCSTWVAVGGSQLPSPHHNTSLAADTADAGAGTNANDINEPSSSGKELLATPAVTRDLLASVNRKVRQNYIRRRLLTTYRALERLSQSDFNLDKFEAAVANATVPTVVVAPIRDRPNPAVPPTVSLLASDLDPELSRYDRNMMIFNWLHTLDA